MRKLIGKILVWFLKGQTIEFNNGYAELPDYTSKQETDKPRGKFNIK